MEQSVNHYRLVRKLGSGGMGEVYLAEDTRLKRNVALKFLPDHLSRDPEFKARFEHEAQAVAALDHPNIISIYELGEHNGRLYIAMQYLDGRTLQEMLDTEEIPLKEALKIVEQICSGLAKAHEEGVVHRDIKPANIFVTNDGVVKILDFGLAKSRRSTTQTKTGTTVGTLQYESPEQCRGEKVDRRSDIFSVGVLLYQLITGRLPFTGDYDAAIVYAISHETQEPIARYKSGETDEIQRIVDKALAKEPAHRYQRCDEMLADIERFVPGKIVTRKVRLPAPFTLVSIIVLLLVCLIVFWFSMGEQNASTASIKKQLSFSGDIFRAEISPDGKYVAYVTGQYWKTIDNDSMKVFVFELDGGEPVKVFQDWWISQICWSPDSRELLIRADNESEGGFYLMPRFGGTPRRYQLAQHSAFWHMAWSPDGAKFAASYDMNPKDIYIVERESGKIERHLIDGDYDWIYYVSWSARTDHLMITTRKGDDWWLWTINPETGEFTKRVGAYGAANRWNSSGTAIVFQTSRDGGLTSINELKVNPETLEKSGEVEIVTADMQAYDKVSITDDLRRVVFVNNIEWSNLWLSTRERTTDSFSGEERQLTQGTAKIVSPAISPDGSRVAFSKSTGGIGQIYIMNLENMTQEQITYGNSDEGCAWSPDGTQIAYIGAFSDGNKLAIKSLEGGAPKIFDSCEVTGVAPGSAICWAPGENIVFRTPGDRRLFAVDATTKDRKLIGPDIDKGYYYNPTYSPNGRSIAVMWYRTDTPAEYGEDGLSIRGVWIFSVEDTTKQFIRYSDAALLPVGWSKDGSWVYVWTPFDKYLMRINTANITIVDTVAYLPKAQYVDLSTDLTLLVYQTNEKSRDAWLVDMMPVP